VDHPRVVGALARMCRIDARCCWSLVICIANINFCLQNADAIHGRINSSRTPVEREPILRNDGVLFLRHEFPSFSGKFIAVRPAATVVASSRVMRAQATISAMRNFKDKGER
jgi:hypothetical protein